MDEEIDDGITIPLFDDSASTVEGEEGEGEEEKFVVQFGYITDKLLQQINYELGLIKLCWPSITNFEFENVDLYPESYRKNTEKDKALLFYAENFQRQYSTKHKTRRPLFLAAENECGRQKFVSTTINPTKLTYPEFNTWEGCASFASDHITYEEIPDDKATSLPERLLSPETVMRTQSGNCFELATLLASFLIGSGYNAYVVSGYATLEVCSNDLTRSQCPLIIEEPPPVIPPPPPRTSKYVARPVRDLRSKFELMLIERDQALVRAEKERLAEEERLRILELEKPEPDPLYGWRVHSWILMLPGKRDITETFFIEPASGIRCELSDPNYLGIESIWNHTNYWINMQICENGCQDLNFDLQNPSYWEHLLAGEPWDLREVAKDSFNFPDEKDFILQEKHLDMPVSWVSDIELPRNKYTERYPNGLKTVLYRKTRCDLYAPYIHRDGLVWRAITYKDYECIYPETVTESYMYREDCLFKKIRYFTTETTIEYYKSGRDDAMKMNKTSKVEESGQMLREIDFYNEARYDGMKRLEMGPSHIFELFEDREDRLLSRYCKTAIDSNNTHRRTVLSVVEKFSRNPDVPANEDIETREFLIQAKDIILKYHYGEGNITSAKTRMSKSPFFELGGDLTFNPELYSIYKPDPLEKDDRKIVLYNLMIDSLQNEEDTLQHIRGAEDELYSMVRARQMESAQAHLLVSIFDEERNEEARKGMKELEEAMKERSNRETETDIDYLSPYLVLLHGEEITMDKAIQMRDRCLIDFKDTLVMRANKMKSKFEKAANQLSEIQKVHETTSEKTTREKEEAYMANIKGLLFLLNTLEIRIERHKELAPLRFAALSECLAKDPRLAVLYGPKRV